MKITVLAGSPKGDQSVTLQYVLYIQKLFPDHAYIVHHVSRQIGKIEKEAETFEKIIDDVRSSDGVIWAFPLYYFLVPAQYKRFIELLFERNAAAAFAEKYAAVITTSIHFFDYVAHNYMIGISEDLNMRVAGGFSAAMYDLLRAEHQRKLAHFADNFFHAIAQRTPTARSFAPVLFEPFSYHAGPPETRIDAGEKKVLILHDAGGNSSSLFAMVQRLAGCFQGDVKVVNLRDLDVKTGCTGCLRCSYDGTCLWTEKDEYIEFYDQTVKTADLLVFAGTITDRYLSSVWKTYFDRSFYNNHAPTLNGKQVALVVSGPLSQVPNLRQIVQAYVEMQNASLTDVVTDESRDSAHIDALLNALAEKMVRDHEAGYQQPATFFGVAGRKIFRDEIYGNLRFPFQADHRFYKKHGSYDFPYKQITPLARSIFMTLLTKIPFLRKRIYTRDMIPAMIQPFRKLFSGPDR